MPAGSSSHLDNQREYALSSTKIGHCKPLIRHEDAYNTYTRKIQPFCDHLCSHKDVDITIAKSEQRIFQIAFCICCISIESRMAHFRKSFVKLFFDAFCPIACPCKIE
ncbi:MAG: hypothetical protein BWX45_01028 [Deltaproteobacteria bacterium ADurb.Bin002]|nr:MAG: hypothetical protein BWX45_01028 [Deltaproteobacteria bacterium ADurb.Bin002]